MSKDPNPGWTSAPWAMQQTAGGLMPPPPPRAPLSGALPVASTSEKELDLSDSCWESFFSSKLDVAVRGGKFRVYLSERAAEGPLVVCLHGAGYTGLTWGLVAANGLRDSCTIAALVRVWSRLPLFPRRFSARLLMLSLTWL